MKRIALVYFGNLNETNGVSFVIREKWRSKDILKNYNINLLKIFSKNLIITDWDNGILENQAMEPNRSIKSKLRVRKYFRILLDSRIPLFAFIKFYLNLLRPAKSVVNQLSSEKFDTLIFHDLFTAYFYFRLGYNSANKTVLVLHCEKDIYGQLKIIFPGLFYSYFFNRMIRRIVEGTISKVDKLIFVSKSVCDENRIRYPHSDFVLNGIRSIDDSLCHDSNRIPNDFINVISVGSLNFRKGQEIIIEAARILNTTPSTNFRFYLVGEGPQRSYLEKLISTYKLNNVITLLGNRDDVPNLLKEMNLMVLMSKDEGLPLSLIEGIRQGLYILTTDVGGTSEIIGDGFGKLVKRNAEALAIELNNFMTSRISFSEYSVLSQNHFKMNFTSEKMMEKYARIINID